MNKNIFNLIIYFFSTKKVNPLNESLNFCVFTVGKKELKLFSLRIVLDLLRANGVKKIENKKYIDEIIKELKTNIFTKDIFSTPEVHKITNSLSCKCLNTKIDKEIKKDKGMNLTEIPSRFNNEY